MGPHTAAFGLAYAAKSARLDLRSNPSVSVSLADAIGVKATTVPDVED